MSTQRVKDPTQNRRTPIKPLRLPRSVQTSKNSAVTPTSATTVVNFTLRAQTVTFMHTTTLSVASVALHTLLMLCMPRDLGARPLLEILGDIEPEKGGKTNVGPSARHRLARRRRFVQSHEQLSSQFTGGTVLCTSQTGFNLAIGPGGSVYGVPHSNDPHGKLQCFILDNSNNNPFGGERAVYVSYFRSGIFRHILLS